MGLFNRKESSQTKNLRNEAQENVQYIHVICEIIGDNTKFFIEMADIIETFVPYAEEAMKIFNEATDITGKSISELKNFDVTTSAFQINSYKTKIDTLHAEITDLLRRAKNEDD